MSVSDTFSITFEKPSDSPTVDRRFCPIKGCFYCSSLYPQYIEYIIYLEKPITIQSPFSFPILKRENHENSSNFHKCISQKQYADKIKSKNYLSSEAQIAPLLLKNQLGRYKINAKLLSHICFCIQLEQIDENYILEIRISHQKMFQIETTQLLIKTSLERNCLESKALLDSQIEKSFLRFVLFCVPT